MRLSHLAFLLSILFANGCGQMADDTSAAANAAANDDGDDDADGAGAGAAADLRALQGVKIYFGHHSVGANILDGVHALEARAGGAKLDIDDGGVGKNGDPIGKVEDFARQAIAHDDADIALMKLCFVDFRPDTDVDAVLAAYITAIGRVRAARPGLVIVHVTPPLGARENDLKTRLKRSLGRQVWSDASNVKRWEFARKLVEAFPGDPVFDLTRVESTRPDGTRARAMVNGASVPVLWDGYTDDGGHLNDAGKRVAARAFLATLAAAAAAPRRAAAVPSRVEVEAR